MVQGERGTGKCGCEARRSAADLEDAMIGKLLGVVVGVFGILCLAACVFVLMKALIIWVEVNSSTYASIVGFVALVMVVYYANQQKK